MKGGLSTKEAAKEAARLVPGLARKEAYALAIKLSSGSKIQDPWGKLFRETPGQGRDL